MDQKETVFWIALVVFNLSAVALLRLALTEANIGQALQEKSSAGAVADTTSYSRLAGLVGAVVLAAFFWGLGNVVIRAAVFDPAGLDAVVKGVGGYLLSGAALFAPYAFNQLARLFKVGA